MGSGREADAALVRRTDPVAVAVACQVAGARRVADECKAADERKAVDERKVAAPTPGTRQVVVRQA